MKIRKTIKMMSDPSWIEWQEAFTAGRLAGRDAHKGKADKLQDSQRNKHRPAGLSVNAGNGWEAGFNFGWTKYRPANKKKKATKKKVA